MRNLNNLSDYELLCLLRDDYQLAFTEIYNRYWQTLYAVAYNRLRDSQQSEDAVHDVFAGLWSNRHKSEINNPAAYLATAVKFRVFENIRKKSIKQNYLEYPSHLDSNETYDISEALHYKRLLQAVNEEVESLPEQCRLVFKYSREENMPLKQIASHMNLSNSTVENHLNRALKRLRTVIKKLSILIFSF